jgi:zinc protease
MKIAALLAALGTFVAPELPVEQYRLSNGLTVVLSPDRDLPIVATEVLYLVGSGHEVAGRTGFAHLFEHLMFQGSKNFDKEYFEPFEPAGGSVNGTTNRDRTNYFERVPSNYLELSLWMESERMENLLPALGQKKLDNQRDVVRNERRQRYENQPYGMAWWYLAEMLYPPGHPYRHEPIGSHEDLTAASLDDVRGFFKKYYVPANAVLAVSGDFASEALKPMIERYFGGIPGGVRAAPPTATRPTLRGSVQRVIEDNITLPRIYLAWHSPALFEPGDAELDLFSNVSANGKSSRLYKALVYDQRVAKDVSAFQVSQKLSSLFVIQVTAAPGETIDSVYTALLPALKKALTEPPSQDELERAKNDYKKSFYQRLESVASRVSNLASYVLYAGRADYFDEDLARYVKASAADVHGAARRWIDLENLVRLDFVPRKPAAPAPAKPGVPAR